MPVPNPRIATRFLSCSLLDLDYWAEKDPKAISGAVGESSGTDDSIGKGEGKNRAQTCCPGSGFGQGGSRYLKQQDWSHHKNNQLAGEMWTSARFIKKKIVEEKLVNFITLSGPAPNSSGIQANKPLIWKTEL